MGKKFTVRITETGKHYLKGAPVQQSAILRPNGVPQPHKQGEITGLSPCQSTDSDQLSEATGHHPLFMFGLFVLIACVVVRLYYIFIIYK